MPIDFELSELADIFDYGDDLNRLLTDCRYKEAYFYVEKLLGEEEKHLLEMQEYVNNSLENSQYGDVYELTDIENNLELVCLQRRKIDQLVILKNKLQAFLISLKENEKNK